MDVFRLSEASDPQIRPDGAAIAYVRIANDVMTDAGRKTIWILDTKTGDQRPVKGVEVDAYEPRWSPDGSRIAFLAAPTKQNAGIYVYELRSGLTRRIATLPRSASDLSWSRSAAQIAFVMRAPAPAETMGRPLEPPPGAKWAEPLKVTTRAIYRKDGEGDLPPGYNHVFVVASSGGVPRQVTSGASDDEGPVSWGPNDRDLVFAARRGPNWEREPLRSAIYRVSLSDGSLTRLTQQEGPDSSAAVSPDGRMIAFSGFDDTRRRSYANRRIFVMNTDGGGIRQFGAGLDRSLDHPHWAHDDLSVYADYADRGITKVVRLDISSGHISTVAAGPSDDGLDLPYTGGTFSVADDGTITFPQGSASHPPEVAIAHDGRVTRLTFLNNFLNTKTLARLTPLPVTSSFDNTPIDAWMLKPPNFDSGHKWPMILEIHGGPFFSYGPYFSTDDQLYAAAGYIVVYANERGSTSYGDAFANGVDRNFPGNDYYDLMSAVDAAVATGFVDPARLFVTGGSSGGILTSWIVGKTHRFRAAVAQRAGVNWTSLVLTSDSGIKTMQNWKGATPWDDPVGYWKHSPLSLVGNVTTPTLLIFGDRDVVTPEDESEQFFGALQYPRRTHRLDKGSRRLS